MYLGRLVFRSWSYHQQTRAFPFDLHRRRSESFTFGFAGFRTCAASADGADFAADADDAVVVAVAASRMAREYVRPDACTTTLFPCELGLTCL